MRRHLPAAVGLALVAVGLARAVGGSAATPPPSPPPDFAPAPTYAGADACTLANAAMRSDVHLGSPRGRIALPATGLIDLVIVAIDFPDAPGKGTPEEAAEAVAGDLPEWIRDMSYGTATVRVTSVPAWVHMGKDSTAYGYATSAGVRALVNEALVLADADYDFSATEVVIVLAPAETPESLPSRYMGFDPRFFPVQADGQPLSHVIALGADAYDTDRLVSVHELGHALGLPDLYMMAGNGTGSGGTGAYTGDFGLMGTDWGVAPELFAYERWVLGWIESSQIACLEGDGGVSLTAIEVEGGTKAAMVPIGPHRLLVVESRRSEGHDSRMGEDGALVYTVDVSRETGKGPIEVYPGYPMSREGATLQVGESITVEGVTVSVLWADGTTDLVEIDSASPDVVTPASG